MSVRAAVIARVRTNAALTVFDGSPPDRSQPPYVVVYVSTDREDQTSLQGRTDRGWGRIITHSVGTTPDQTDWVYDRVRATLIDHRLVVDGLQSWPIRHSEGRPTVTDETTGVRVLDQVDVWTFQTAPTA